MSVPFVGRQRELDELGGLIQRSSRARAPAAAVVTGQPGSGKTRLLAEVTARSAYPRHVRVIGFEPNQAVPLAAVGEVIRALATVPVHGPRLEALVFGGRDRASRTPIRIFEAGHRALSAHGPLLIGIDDLQWVDEQSLGFIQYLLRAADPARQMLTVVAMSRPAPAAATFASTVEGLFPPERRAIVELGPMPIDEGLSLARAIDGRLDDPTAEAIWHRSRGSPFWLEALARNGGDMEPSQLIDDRLRALSTDAGVLLATLAVGARPFLLEEVAELLAWEAGRVGQACRELVSRGLGAEVSGAIRLAHDLIREAAAASLPPAARRRLHIRVADWIQANAGDDVKLLREALDHRVEAGQSGAELASRLLSSPGRRLLNRDDLRLLASISDQLRPGTAERTKMDRVLGELAGAIGEVDLALERWTRVGEGSADASERRHAETEAAMTAYRFGRRDDAHRHIARARLLPAELDGTVRLDALQADVELWLDHETATGSRTANEALAAADEMAHIGGGLEALSPSARRAYLAAVEVAMDAAMQEGRDDAIPSLAERCVRAAAGLDDESHIAAQIRAGQALRTVLNSREGETLDRQAWDASRRLVMPMLTIGAGRELARSVREQGRLAEAHAIAEETRQLEARLTDAPKHWGSAPSLRHVIELSLADPVSALRELRRDARAEPDPHYSQDVHLAIAVWLARVTGPAAAADVEAELGAAHADAALARCPRHNSTLALATAELLARVGRVAEARHALDEWDRAPGPKGVNRGLWRTRAAAAVLTAAGDNEPAAALLEKYAEGLEAAGLEFELIWARIDLGRCLATVDRDRAVAAFVAAADVAERCGAATEGRLIAQALRRLGVRAWRRGSAATGVGVRGLSTREQEISRHVAEGASNREIADSLLLSAKTVERHLTNILAKLGLRNRTELASLVRSAGPVRDSPDD
jgi:DNA-binding CsgD family transcriptional regulator